MDQETPIAVKLAAAVPVPAGVRPSISAFMVGREFESYGEAVAQLILASHEDGGLARDLLHLGAEVAARQFRTSAAAPVKRSVPVVGPQTSVPQQVVPPPAAPAQRLQVAARSMMRTYALHGGKPLGAASRADLEASIATRAGMAFGNLRLARFEKLILSRMGNYATVAQAVDDGTAAAMMRRAGEMTDKDQERFDGN